MMDKVIQDNSGPDTAQQTVTKLEEFQLECIKHPHLNTFNSFLGLSGKDRILEIRTRFVYKS